MLNEDHIQLDAVTFLRGCDYLLSKAAHEGKSKCRHCSDTAISPMYCCNGMECGCMGKAVDFDYCECSAIFPLKVEIEAAAKLFPFTPTPTERRDG